MLPEHKYILERLQEKTIILDNGCWIFTGYCNNDGYGQFKIKSRSQRVHRSSWIIHKGLIPSNLHVLHSCDNPPCWNPEHLFLGTHQDNMHDRNTKNRQARQYCSINGRSRLNEQDVVFIKLDLQSNQFSLNEIARSFGVCKSTIVHIKMGRTWRINMPILYNCKCSGDEYRISKFDADLNIEASYLTNGENCDCPAGHRPVCRHRIMLVRFIAKNATAGQWFHNYEHDQWIRAASDDEPNTLGDLASVASELTIASSVSFPNDVSGNELANAFAGLMHQPNDTKMLESIRQGCLGNEPKPINLLELAKPTSGGGSAAGRLPDIVTWTAEDLARSTTEPLNITATEIDERYKNVEGLGHKSLEPILDKMLEIAKSVEESTESKPLRRL